MTEHFLFWFAHSLAFGSLWSVLKCDKVLEGSVDVLFFKVVTTNMVVVNLPPTRRIPSWSRYGLSCLSLLSRFISLLFFSHSISGEDFDGFAIFITSFCSIELFVKAEVSISLIVYHILCSCSLPLSAFRNSNFLPLCLRQYLERLFSFFSFIFFFYWVNFSAVILFCL